MSNLNPDIDTGLLLVNLVSYINGIKKHQNTAIARPLDFADCYDVCTVQLTDAYSLLRTNSFNLIYLTNVSDGANEDIVLSFNGIDNQIKLKPLESMLLTVRYYNQLFAKALSTSVSASLEVLAISTNGTNYQLADDTAPLPAYIITEDDKRIAI